MFLHNLIQSIIIYFKRLPSRRFCYIQERSVASGEAYPRAAQPQLNQAHPPVRSSPIYQWQLSRKVQIQDIILKYMVNFGIINQ